MTKNVQKALDRLASGGLFENPPCPHVGQIEQITPSTMDGCEDCLKLGDRWFHLRICMTCGHVGCCDNSKNRHATKHFEETGHPIVMSFEPGEFWLWCYEDNKLVVR